MRMTKLIRNPLTRQFLGPEARWTPDLSKAEPVSDYYEAAAIVRLLGLKTAELYYCFSNTFWPQDWDFTIPLAPTARPDR